MQKSEDDWLWDNTKVPQSSDAADRLGLAKAFSRCFSGVDGELALRHLGGQRQLVLYITTLIDRGLTPL